MQTTTPKKIAVLGYAPNVRHAPWEDPTFSIWGLNDQSFTMPRVDVLFELHDADVIKAEGHWERLAQLKIPIFMQQHYPDIPTSIPYPLGDVAAKYTVFGCDKPFITCSASYMLPVAIEQPGVEEIHVFGVNMEQDTEYGHQRPSCEFFLGVAHGRGIKLVVQGSSDLLKTKFLYGFETEQMTVFSQQAKERHAWLQQQHDQAQAEEAAAKERRLQYAGAIQDIAHFRQRYVTF